MSIPPMSGPPSGVYTITSLSGKGGVVGVAPILPAFQQLATFPENPFDSKWQVTRTPKGTYLLSILNGYRYSGVLDDRIVIATIHEHQSNEWEITSFQYQGPNLYAIQLVDRSKAWTLDNVDSEEQSRIIAERLQLTKDLPPQALPYQLFQIRRVDE
ncbi:hypothetical protein BDP27DRAFT_1450863 [Rhodocollybia butyracea]|uniref:Uncharacterized protein n=1 Tax=Rhodocollybia butyracea TaxID=206335 RepID=A0A9P5U222_9AGAR|nr:hypothetical protein BDP27DRAFT_1450863 [Rhodocollybia butyracea]